MDSGDPLNVSDDDYVPEKPSKILGVALGFLIPTLIIGFLWGGISSEISFDITANIMDEMEHNLNCRASERGGVILCISNFDNIRGVIFNMNDDAVYLIKALDSSGGGRGYEEKSLDTEWSQEIASGDVMEDEVSYYHRYHIFKNGTYQGVLMPFGQEYVCPRDPPCA